MHLAPFRRAATALLITLGAAALGGCAVVTAIDTTASLAVSAVGLAGDAAIGTARVAGRAVGAAADLVIPDTKSE